jgi:hypothetical protein
VIGRAVMEIPSEGLMDIPSGVEGGKSVHLQALQRLAQEGIPKADAVLAQVFREHAIWPVSYHLHDR